MMYNQMRKVVECSLKLQEEHKLARMPTRRVTFRFWRINHPRLSRLKSKGSGQPLVFSNFTRPSPRIIWSIE